jgi:hypothetical protein
MSVPPLQEQDSSNPLDTIRQILFAEETRKVEALDQRLNNPDERARDIAEILPQAIQYLQDKKEKQTFAHALATPMEQAIQTAIRKDPKSFADVLYPVILPSIRRAVTEMLRGFVERIDTIVSQKFSIQSLKWRLEAMRTGVPFAEILLRNTVLYSVEQVLLIQRHSGRLMQHSFTSEAKGTDSDAVSAMLLAIQQFVRDAFVEEEDSLRQVDIGEHRLYVFEGPYALLACVVDGHPPSSFSDDMQAVLEQIHVLESAKLEQFSGDKTSLSTLKPILDQCLHTEFRKREGKEKARDIGKIFKWAGAAAVMLLLMAAGVLFYNSVQTRQVNDYIAMLNQQPGISITKVEKQDGIWRLEGLADPLAAVPELDRKTFFLDSNDVAVHLTPFQGLDDSIVAKRSAESLRLPEGMSYSLENRTFKVEGRALPYWFLQMRNRETPPQGVDRVDLAAVTIHPEEAMRFFAEMLSPPDSVKYGLVDGDRIVYEGWASLDWIHSLDALLLQQTWKENVLRSAVVHH